MAACDEDAAVPEPIVEPSRASEAYRMQLERAGLLAAPLGQRWAGATDQALEQPGSVTLPFTEAGYFEADHPEAVAYRISLRRGERLEARIAWQAADSSDLFVDMYQPGRNGGALRLMEGEAVTADTFSFEPRRDQDYLIVIQPPLLSEGRYEVRLRRVPTFAFPVSGHDPGSIRSVFGDPREGGRREHHGVDIFAARGTPAVAGVNGRVSRVDTTRLGGLVVWLRDADRSQSLYYAHLDRQLVRRGARVQVGDTLGLIGNTGNARTTPPHLHFGVYRRGQGPLDPAPFINPADTAWRAVGNGPEYVEWRRSGRARVVLREGVGRSAPPVDTLGIGTPLRVVATAPGWLRVHVPDGRRGYLRSRDTEPATAPIDQAVPDRAAPLLAAPDADAPVRAAIESGGDARLDIYGRLGAFEWVGLPDGTRGWRMVDGS